MPFPGIRQRDKIRDARGMGEQMPERDPMFASGILRQIDLDGVIEEQFACCSSSRMAVAVKGLVVEPSPKTVCGVIGRCHSRFASP
jgi:hypothetical protein